MKRSIWTAALLTAAILLTGYAARATDFIWDAGGSGNWTTATNWDKDSGDPNGTNDTATIVEAGTYIVTLDANRVIGGFTLNSANAAVDTGANTLTTRGLPSTTIPAVFSHISGSLDGTFAFFFADVNLNDATSATGATFLFSSPAGSGSDNAPSTINFGPAGQIAANQTLHINDNGIVKRNIHVTTSHDVVNNGTIIMETNGEVVTADNTDTVRYNITTATGGTLTNKNLMSMQSSSTNNARAELNANFINDTGATFTGTNPTDGTGRIEFTRAGATHENRGSFTVSSGQFFVRGGGTTFTQSGTGASLDMARFTFGTNDSSANTFTINGGTIDGLYEFQKANVTLASGVTSNTSATFRFVESADTTNVNTLTLGSGQLDANQTVEVINPLGGTRRQLTLNMSSFTNNGTINVFAAGQAGIVNPDDVYFKVTNTLTNNGTLALETGTSTFATPAAVFLQTALVNQSAGIVTVKVNTAAGEQAGDINFGTAGAAHSNSGTITLQTAGRRLVVTGSSLTNNSDGTIEGTGTLDVSALTSGGALVNNGTLSPGLSPGILTVNGNYTQGSTGTLLIEIVGNGGVAGTDFDQLIVTGDASLDGTLQIDILGSYEPDPFDSFLIFSAAGVTGSFSNLTGNLVYAYRGGDLAGTFQVTIDEINGIVTLGSFVNIPEPASAVLLGLAGLVLLHRRRGLGRGAGSRDCSRNGTGTLFGSGSSPCCRMLGD